jgi:gluconokinase
VIIVVMGVSGSGKSTVGKLLAQELRWTFVEGDDFHPRANIEKMHRGIPLDDKDRWPWLNAIHLRLEAAVKNGENVVLACSALMHSYQHYLAQFTPESIRNVYLAGSESLIRERLARRTGHFMNPALLHSQFETLEPPEGAIQVDIGGSPESIVSAIRTQLGL